MSGTDLECQQIVELVTDYLEGALTEEQRARFDAHVERCVSCTRYLDQMWLTVQAVGRLPASDVDDRSKEKLLQLFREWTRR